MKNLKTISTLGLLLLLATLGVHGQEVGKKWSKTYPVSSASTLQIDNSYGDIEVKTWNQPEIQIEVQVEIEGKSDKKLQDLLDNITIEDKTNGKAVYLVTDFGTRKISNVEMSIDYVVMMPNTIPLTLQNAFGNIGIPDYKGQVNIDLDYGNLKAAELDSKNSKLELSFSNGVVASYASGEIGIEYGNLEIESVGVVKMKSAFSNFEFDEVEALNLHSEYDNFEIDQISAFEVRAQFSNFEIESLTGLLVAELGYSGFEVKEVTPEFSKIEIDAEMGGIELKMDGSASYNYDLMSKMGDVETPIGGKNTLQSEKDYSKHFIGSKGNNPENRLVKIVTSYGDIELR